MRVIAGTCKGRTLFGPKTSSIRPALDQVKESIFNILFNVERATVLDLFAGTGSVGIEALSRGASSAVFVDQSEEAVRLIEKNLKICGLIERATVFKMPVGTSIRTLSKKGGSFDLIFVDPPYLKKWVRKTLDQLAQSSLLLKTTQVVVEHHPKEPMIPPPGLELTDQRKYGQTIVSFLKKTEVG